MPSIANITVKAANGTTDVVYTAKQPSSGDGVPAVWRAEASASAPALMPELRLLSRPASNGAVRHVRATFVFPQWATNSTTGVASVVTSAFGTLDVKVPRDMTSANANEVAAHFANLLASALIKQCLAEGYSAT